MSCAGDRRPHFCLRAPFLAGCVPAFTKTSISSSCGSCLFLWFRPRPVAAYSPERCSLLPYAEDRGGNRQPQGSNKPFALLALWVSFQFLEVLRISSSPQIPPRLFRGGWDLSQFSGELLSHRWELPTVLDRRRGFTAEGHRTGIRERSASGSSGCFNTGVAVAKAAR